MSRMSGKDTKTRYQGVFARHQKDCAINAGKRCTCKPSYYGVVWDRARKRHVKTKRMPTIEAARNARSDLSGRVERGELPDGGGIPISDARARFVSAAPLDTERRLDMDPQDLLNVVDGARLVAAAMLIKSTTGEGDLRSARLTLRRGVSHEHGGDLRRDP